MNKDAFGSFKVNHEKLERGIYLSREEVTPCGTIYTLDIRTNAPYKESTNSEMTSHSVEHFVATQLEDVCKNSDIKKVYFGPMGCNTGFYMLLYVPIEYVPKVNLAYDLCEIVRKSTLHFMGDIPFDSKKECGNYFTLAEFDPDVDKVDDIINRIKDLANKCKEKESFDEYPYL